MLCKLFGLLAVLAAPVVMGGCGVEDFAENQARRQAARSADYYFHHYAEPELQHYAGGDPQDMRQLRNDMADTIVRTGNPNYSHPVGVNDRGWLTH